MPTTIPKISVQFIECCGVVVPITSNRNAEREAYKELATGGLLALAIAIPFSAVTFFFLL
ncbi:hypothetical protein V2V90_24890 (plasmid) [Agrobacterium leguminum]|uniref:hypothetical protein n=1 Tax=Agrobacterium leguminum TaxID=2792015 RepID=UPI0030CDFA9D